MVDRTGADRIRRIAGVTDEGVVTELLVNTDGSLTTNITADSPLDVSVTLDVPLGYQQITSLSSAAALTVPTGAKRALIQAQDKDVRWRDDGTDPTASVGMVIAAGDTLPYTGDLADIKIIETAASAKLNVSYYG